MIDTDAIRSKVNLIDLVKTFGLKVNHENKCLCIFHEDSSPSMKIYQDHVYCFSCYRRADAISVIEQIKGTSFKDAADYLSQQYGIPMKENPAKTNLIQNLIATQKPIVMQKSIQEHPLFQKRMTLLTKFHEFTNNEITEDKDYSQAYNWIKNRGYNFEFLIEKSFVESNFLFYTEADLNKFKNEIGVESLKEIELVKSNNQFCWLGGNYNLAFPCWYPVLDKETKTWDWKATSLKIRNTGDNNDKSTKEVELILPKVLKDENYPSSLGFYGLKYWASIYPQVLNQCEGLTVYLTEGPSDMIAGFHLLHKKQNTVVLSAGTVQKANQFHNIDLIKKCKTLVIAFDNDNAGYEATKKLIVTAKKAGILNIQTVKFPDETVKDLNDFLKTYSNASNQQELSLIDINMTDNKSYMEICTSKFDDDLMGIGDDLVKENNKIESFDPIQFIKGYVSKKNYKVLANGQIISRDNQYVKDFENEVFLNAYYGGAKSGDAKMLNVALQFIITKIKEKKMKELKLKMDVFIPDQDDNLSLFIKALTGVDKCDDEYSFIRFCFEHFIRQVKCKISGIPVYQELMLVVVGTQDQGKTSAIRYLLEPLRHFYSERSLGDISDPEKNCNIFEDNFVILCEEMRKAESSNIETFKSIVTAKEINVRKYYSQNHKVVKNNSTLIGSSNKPTSDVIYDTTGMRRFIDINITIPKCDFDALEKINYLAIWQGVEHDLSKEKKALFFEEYKTRIKPRQEEMRAKECVELFIHSEGIEKGEVLCPASQAYSRYKQWCAINGFNNPKNSIIFSKKMVHYLKIKAGANYKDSRGNRALPLNKFVKEHTLYSGY